MLAVPVAAAAVTAQAVMELQIKVEQVVVELPTEFLIDLSVAAVEHLRREPMAARQTAVLMAAMELHLQLLARALHAQAVEQVVKSRAAQAAVVAVVMVAIVPTMAATAQ
jgi:hypothetical protein